MILAIDVQYTQSNARAAGVTFAAWPDAAASGEYVSWVEGVAPYEAGSFYKRELPCILKLIEAHHLVPDCMVVDGLAFLDGKTQAGLGKHLYDALGGRIPVIGVAKSRFHGVPDECAVYRGGSQRPLYVNAAGMELELAKECVRTMHGENRLPTLLKQVDRLCRSVR